MNDEQFEDAMQTIENNIYSNLAQELRDHNAAQREALARVEAELKAKPADDLAQACIAQLIESGAENYTEHHFIFVRDGEDVERPAVVTVQFSNRPSPHELRIKAEAERKTAQYRLVEALWHLDGVLNNLPEDMSHRFGGSRSFLARHAQAEQQEASEGDWPNGANVKLKWICDETELTGWARLEAGILYSVHSGVPLKTGCWKIVEDRSSGVAASRQEAQGAQAGDLASAVRVLLEVPQLQGEQAFSAQPIIDRVRAALATQPAVSVSAEAMSFEYAHISGERRTVSITREDVIEGMEDALYEKLSDQICRCEPIGETNIVECNCQDYVQEFTLVSAKPAVRGAENGH